MTTAQKIDLNVDVKPSLIYSAVAVGPFDLAKKALESESYDVISLPINAELRIKQGKEAYISQNGNWVREGVIYVPGKGNKLVRNSPILYSAQEATQAHRQGMEFYTTNEAVKKALEDFVDFPLNNKDIPTNRFNTDSLTVWAFGAGDAKKAQAYGDFLKDSGINSMSVYAVDKNYVNEQNSPFVRQLWFSRLVGRSGLYGNYRFLRNGDRVRGVRSADAEGVASKNSN